MENNTHINQLLEKFWTGESSLEEENQLRKAVFDPNASDELKALQSFFLGPIERSPMPNSADQKFNQAFEQIRAQELLKKYYAGETSLEEEATLKTIVNKLPSAITNTGSEVDDFKTELAIAKMIFPEDEEIKLSSAGEKKMLTYFDELKEQKAKVVPLKQAKVRTLPKRNWLKIAVVGLLLIGVGSIWTKRVNDMEKAEAQLAYQQTKEAFELLGMHFNKGEETTINTLRNASENLGILN